MPATKTFLVSLAAKQYLLFDFLLVIKIQVTQGSFPALNVFLQGRFQISMFSNYTKYALNMKKRTYANKTHFSVFFKNFTTET
jgi:hypothetical protein